MIVTRGLFDKALENFLLEPALAGDTETFGLRPYHGDKLFSLILACEKGPLYFNFFPYPGLAPEFVLSKHEHLKKLRDLFADRARTWFFHNAPYDMHILGQDGIEIEGTVHCTMAGARVEHSDEFTKRLDLNTVAARIGQQKDDTLKAWLDTNKCYTDVQLGNRKELERYYHYEKAPFEMIVPYAEQDTTVCWKLGHHQLSSITKQDETSPPGRTVYRVLTNERRLTKTVFRMERVGVRCDIPYCKRASAYEDDRQLKAKAAFRKETGKDYMASPVLFATIFEGEKKKWKYTEKGNPSFESDNLLLLDNPAAKIILDIRDAKSKSDFYAGFLYFADANGDVHPNFKPGGTVHGRFSSSGPNFQNLTSEEDEAELAGEFVVRRALIPRPGFIFIMPDFDQMEYRFMLEMACRLLKRETPLVSSIKNDKLDVHAAIVKLVGEMGGYKINRKEAKIANFLTLYGGGPGALAAQLKSTLQVAHQVRGAIFQAAPEIKTYIDEISGVGRQRGFIINWLGRRCYFPYSGLARKAPNYHISGGCADIVKVAMNDIDEHLLGHQSRMVMTIHDELPIEVHEREIASVPRAVHQLMEAVYKSQYLPITAGMEYSTKSLGDKVKGFPV